VIIGELWKGELCVWGYSAVAQSDEEAQEGGRRTRPLTHLPSLNRTSIHLPRNLTDLISQEVRVLLRRPEQRLDPHRNTLEAVFAEEKVEDRIRRNR